VRVALGHELQYGTGSQLHRPPSLILRVAGKHNHRVMSPSPACHLGYFVIMHFCRHVWLLARKISSVTPEIIKRVGVAAVLKLHRQMGVFMLFLMLYWWTAHRAHLRRAEQERQPKIEDASRRFQLQQEPIFAFTISAKKLA